MTGFHPEVQRGLTLAIEAERRGFLSAEKLNEILAYYDHEGAVYPAPAREVLERLGRVTPEQLRELLGLGAPPTQVRELTARLVLLEPLGEGGMGTVYKAQDRVLRRVVAVKLIRRDRLASEQSLHRFEREAAVMARVHHPACVPVYDAGVAGDEPYLVMKYVPGASLRGELTKFPRGADPRRVARWGQQLAEGLQACHEAGVIHRDVKPGNVLLDEQDQPLLTDFGVALDGEARTKLTLASGAVGTLAYMPPEQAAGEVADARSDVYSLGATLYEALVGEPPFVTDQPLALIRMIVESSPAPPRARRPDLPEDLERVVLKCLQKSREDRYPTAQLVALDLARWLAGEPVNARPLSPARRLARRAWRRRRTLAGLAIAATLLGAAATVSGLAMRRAARLAALDAISAAGLSSDRGSAEAALVQLSSHADPGVAEEAQLALKQLRVRAHLSEAEAELARWERLAERESELEVRLSELARTIDEARAVRDYPDKQERLALKSERERLPGFLQEAISAVERALVRAEGFGVLPQAIDQVRARLLLALARHTLLQDPELAEAYYARAADADAGSGRCLARDLSPAHVTVDSDVPAHFAVYRLAHDPVEGRAISKEVAAGEIPGSVDLASGEFVIELTSHGRLPVRDTLLLARGESRRCRLELPKAELLGPLAEEVVAISPGPVRGRVALSRLDATNSTILMARYEVSLEAWRSHWIEQGAPDALLPIGTADPKELLVNSTASTMPVFGVAATKAETWCAQLSRDLALAGVQVQARLPSLSELRRAVRGDFAWIYPWGRLFDPAFTAMSLSKKRRVPTIGEFPADVSPFGVRDLAGGVAELTIESDSTGYRMAFGGSVGDDSISVQAYLLFNSTLLPTFDDEGCGFRYVLSPGAVEIPAPDPTINWRAKAYRHARSKEWKDALQAARSWIALAPKDAGRWLGRCELRMMAGDTWGARFDAAQATILAPQRSEAWLVRGAVELKRGESRRAVEHCTRALELDPKNAMPYWTRALAGKNLGEWDEVVADLEAFLAAGPGQRHAGEYQELAPFAAEALVKARAKLAEGSPKGEGTAGPGQSEKPR